MRVVATAGHVDHGKSSLVLALTGTDPDRFAEEKRRGLTIDLGFAHATLPSGEEVAFVDVPGHIRFLRNMLAGVGAVDACVFVVAATEGWKPQSEEHLRILELLGIRHGIVALTKVDAAGEELAELAAMDVADHVAGTFLEHAAVVPVAAPLGLGLDDLRAALDRLVAATPPASDRGRARLWVDRVFAAKGSGTVVTGTLTGGELTLGQQLVVGPAARPVRLRGIQSHGAGAERIGPGHRVALNLAGVEHTEVERGHAVVEPGRWRPTTRFDASLSVLASLDHEVSRRGAHAVHLGSGEFPCKVRVLGADALAPGTEGLVRVHLRSAVPLLPGDRFILRESGRSETIGGGEVLDIAPVLAASKARPDRRVERVVAERGWVETDELELLTGERLRPTIGRWVTAPGVVDGLAVAIEDRVANAGPVGLDVAALDDRERAVLATLTTVTVDAGRARPAAAHDPFADHPFILALERGGFEPPPPPGDLDRAVVRELIRRGHAWERDSIVFPTSAIDAAARVAARLLGAKPSGITMAELRDGLGVSRKYAVPIATELDARGITRRRDDLRIAGPRLP